MAATQRRDTMGIYVHIPFCIQKCNYCDFLSFCANEEQRDIYISALLKEIGSFGSLYGKQGKNYRVQTIYFGGGTPSILDTIEIQKILTALHNNFEIEETAEITMECNPGTVSVEKFRSYYKMGICRISMGLQSADDEELRILGRIHTLEDFLQGYEEARQAGFQNINIDVMSALPWQTFESYQNTLRIVTQLEPEHISAYSLIIEEGTPFYQMREKGKLLLPSEEEERRMYYETKSFLEKQGYLRYEISNYAKKGFEAVHNSSYWTGKNYLGFGLGAASYIEGIRFQNTDSMKRYLQQMKTTPVSVQGAEIKLNFAQQEQALKNLLAEKEEVQYLSEKETREEFMFLGLRMMQGVRISEFEQRFSVSFEECYGEIVWKLQEQGLLIREGDRIFLSSYGIDVSNHVLAEFL